MSQASRWTQRIRNLAALWRGPPAVVGASPAAVVHTENKLRLLRYFPAKTGVRWRTPIVLVPSLINRHYILDLAPEKSMVAWLLQQGHDVFCIDWGKPSPEDRYLDFEDYADTYLSRCIRVAAGLGASGRVHVVGYCMGGILAAARAAIDPTGIASFVSLAAPVRFDDSSLLSTWTRNSTFDTAVLASATGNVPWQLLQGSFNLLRPTLPMAKLVGVIDKADSEDFLAGFGALEKWANDNVSIPGAFYRTYIDTVYRRGGLLTGELVVRGRPVSLRNIVSPTLTIAFEQDTIAPPDNCAALHDIIASSDKKLLRLPGSHVGSVVSRKAKNGVWLAISTWCRERDNPPY